MENKEIRDATVKINSTICNNLKKLLEIHGLTVSNICKHIEESKELSVHRTTFNRFMNDPGNSNLPIVFLVSCCNYFKLSMDNLLSDNFNPYENYKKFNDVHAELLISANADGRNPQGQRDVSFTHPDYPANEIFVENPNSPLLKKYLQTYYCYYYSTVSSENKTDDTKEAMLSGTLKLEPDGARCKAILSIDTKTCDENGNPNYKIYEGNAVVCPSIQSLQCILHHPEGEFCFMIFRYSHLFFNNQECRLAEVLSTSSTSEKRYPTVLRMLLSKERIEDKDLEEIAPHLGLNYSNITISKAGLENLAKVSEKYGAIVQKIFETEPEEMYRIKEKKVAEIAKEFLDEDETALFLTKMRAHSFAYRYNKVSPKADDTLRKLLGQMGYYKKKKIHRGSTDTSQLS